jgi:hypothetical protein
MKFYKLTLYLNYVRCLAYYNTNQIGQYLVHFIYQKFRDSVAGNDFLRDSTTALEVVDQSGYMTSTYTTNSNSVCSLLYEIP